MFFVVHYLFILILSSSNHQLLHVDRETADKKVRPLSWKFIAIW